MRQVELLEARRLFDFGDIDPSFGSQGIAEIDFAPVLPPASFDIAPLVTEDNAGRVLVVARVGPPAGSSDTTNFVALARLHVDGTPDARFGENGVQAMPTLTENVNTRIEAEIDPTGRVYLLDGQRVLRFTTGGKLDATFGRRGKARVPEGIHGERMFADPNGGVFVVGAERPNGASADSAVVLRFTESGQLDRSWAEGGMFRAKSFAPKGAGSRSSKIGLLRILSDGRLMLAGTEQFSTFSQELEGDVGNEVAFTTRLDLRGGVDASYGDDGYATDHATGTLVLFVGAVPDAILADGSFVETQTFLTDSDQDTGSGQSFIFSPDGKTRRQLTVSEVNGLVENPNVSVSPDGTELNVQTSETVSPLGVPIVRLFRDHRPIGRLNARNLTAQREGGYAFDVTWSDDDGVQESSLDSRDVVVTRPDGTSVSAKLVSTTLLGNGAIRARYKVAARDGTWDANDNGGYSIRTRAGEVLDVNGAANHRRPIGAFRVDVA